MRRIGPFVIRWAARCTALIVAGLFLVLVGGEMLDPHSGPPSSFREWAGIVLFICSIAGMLLAWRWELTGAAFSLATLAVFLFVVRITRYDIVAIAAVPGILFFGDWVVRRLERPEASR
jgi:hypothetical protein